jgi:hypothetical protein
MTIIVTAAAAKRFQSSSREDGGCFMERCHGSDVLNRTEQNREESTKYGI